jgi:N-acetylneuraminate synthase|tara:strand:+ start:9714 stop:10547 length:834 start_codon:yes stop_codon:yes gene_type:complete
MKNGTIFSAEIGINHNGDINLAKELIDLASTATCTAVKFQKRNINEVYSQEELDKPRESPWGTTTREQKEGLEFSIEEYIQLEKYCDSVGIDFGISCWDINSLNQVEEHLNVKSHKIASAMLTDKDFIAAINETNKPVILSTGMSTPEQIDKSVSLLKNIEYILACTSTYPTLPAEVNLRYITALKSLYPGIKIGFSNHSSSAMSLYAAAALEAEYIEFHITKDRSSYGSDQASSINNAVGVVSGMRKIKEMLGVSQKTILDSEKPILKKLRKVDNI